MSEVEHTRAQVRSRSNVRAVLLVMLSLALGIGGLLLWRHAIAGAGGFALDGVEAFSQFGALLTQWSFWVGTLLLGGVAVISLELYGNEALSSVLPLYSVGYIVVALVDRFVFGQVVPLQRWLGILLILAGVVVVVRSN